MHSVLQLVSVLLIDLAATNHNKFKSKNCGPKNSIFVCTCLLTFLVAIIIQNSQALKKYLALRSHN